MKTAALVVTLGLGLGLALAACGGKTDEPAPAAPAAPAATTPAPAAPAATTPAPANKPAAPEAPKPAAATPSAPLKFTGTLTDQIARALELGRTESQAERWPEATQAFDAALALCHATAATSVGFDCARAFAGRGFALVRQRRADIAEQDFVRALELIKGTDAQSLALRSAVLYNRGLAAELLGNKPQALLYYQESNDLHPTPQAKAKLGL